MSFISFATLAENYSYPKTQVVFTSPLKRCTETCQILYPDLSPLSIANLRECNFGEWEGKTADELKNEPDFEKWLGGDNEVAPPHGESNADFIRRICRMFESSDPRRRDHDAARGLRTAAGKAV